MNKDSQSVMRTQKKKKLLAIEAFGGECQICGYNKCSEALEFHHVNKDEKEESPSYIIMRWSFERAKKELEKCILVCSNCHREIHAADKANMSLELQRYVKPWIEKECQFCGKKYNTKNNVQSYCNLTCKGLGQPRKVERPTKEQLEELIKTTNWTQLGRMFGVSDNAVRKWAKHYKII